MVTEDYKHIPKKALEHALRQPEKSPAQTKASLFALAVVSVGLLGWFVYASTNPRQLVIKGQTMGTHYVVKYISGAVDEEDSSATQADFTSLTTGIEDLLERLNAQVSTYDPDSEISKFNNSRSLEPITLSADFFAVVELASKVHERSRFAFDPTIAPLINVWGFGEKTSRKKMVLPDPDALKKAAAKVGFKKHLKLDPQTQSLQKMHPEISVNISAIAKGYGVDKIAQYLEEQGLKHYLVDIGGETRARGMNVNKQPWSVGIQTPTAVTENSPSEEASHVKRVIPLKNMSLATSGTYLNFFIKDGKRYSHILDPRTSYPIDHLVASVSVMAKRCIEADAYATALLVLGLKEGLALAEKLGIAALFMTGDVPHGTNKDFKITTSSAWKSLVKNQHNLQKTQP
ncbi:MAG: FAD:protein FMN transferase [Proteobacteria bacterium]|nr:FAD:protein FMN transferase [Pseudomonadota bacterium]